MANAFYSVPLKKWQVEKVEFTVFVGRSVKDIKLQKLINIE